MASFSSTLRALSSTSIPHSYSYDVFLSFRGEDTRKNFTDHLYNTLIAYGIRSFRDDDELQKGDDIKSGLSTAIQHSKIFLIIFSENYATSDWCLNELVKIVECTTRADDDGDKRSVIPVFYHVKPRDVGHQWGSFQAAFRNHEKDANQEKRKMIKKWRTALQKVAKFSGYHLDNQHETEIIQQIREVIITRLNRKPLYVGDNIVGMDFHLEQLKSLIKIEKDGVYMVGVFGIGGIGKTTMAMAIYNAISSQFYGSSFLRVDGETSNRGLLELQKKLLQDILKGKIVAIQDRSEGISVIKQQLCSKRVLIVLDDVDKIEQLNNLAGKDGWYGRKSIVIITTRDISLLNQHGVDRIYEVKELFHEEAIELFNWWAFKQNIPESEDFKDLSKSVVKYAKGLPLALKVLGGFLYDKSIDEWKSALKKLEKIPNKEVVNILRVSYDKLDEVEQEIFLDIACFFRGKDKDFVSRILGSDADIGIRVLQQRCLITISENELDMHDLLQQMGQEIVRKECTKEAGERSRLWDPIDVQSVLTRNSGTKSIEGLFIEISSPGQIKFSRDSFTNMNRLRLLKVYYKSRDYFKVDLPIDFELSSSELKYFHFWRYPLLSLPTNFQANNLVELDLQKSNIKQLWKENKVLKHLKVINLSHSNNLVEMPDCASMPNLEVLILKGCERLESLPRSFHKLKHLQRLYCSGCSKLKSFPEVQGNMSKLTRLDLGETDIKELPSSIGHLKALKFLNLNETAIKELPSSIGHLTALKSLDLSYCKNLVNFPDSIVDLRSLDTLRVHCCLKLERMDVYISEKKPYLRCRILKPGIIWTDYSFSSLKTLSLLQHTHQMEAAILPLSSLRELSVRNSGNREINGDGFGSLSTLKVICVENFMSPMARGILNDIFRHSSLTSLSLHGCNLMEGIYGNNIWNLPLLVSLSLEYCNLREGEGEGDGDGDGDILNHISHLSSLQELSLEGNHFSSIPATINGLSNLRALNLSSCKQLQQIPVQLPSSLLFLDARFSDGILSSPSLLAVHSLFNRFESKLIQTTEVRVGTSDFSGMGKSIVIPKSSTLIQEMAIKNGGSMGSTDEVIIIKLPENWYENNEFLGFALCCVYDPMLLHDHKYDDNESALQCDLHVRRIDGDEMLVGTLSFRCRYDHLSDDQMWVIYYHKDAIKAESSSSRWAHFMASFSSNGTLKVKECGFHLIYSQEHRNMPKHVLESSGEFW